MKKTVKILLSFILILIIVLVYKIIGHSNEEINVSNTNTQQNNILYVSGERGEYDSIFSEEVKANIIALDTWEEYKKGKQDRTTINKDSIKSEANTDGTTMQQSVEEKTQQSIINNKYDSNKNNENEDKEINKAEYVVEMTNKLRNKFKGYGNGNIYLLESGGMFIQTDWTSQKRILTNPRVELRYYAKEKQYRLYVSGMNTDVEVSSLNPRKGETVFPQLEYSKYNEIIQSFAGSGTINSSSTKPYFDKLEDIKTNWTRLEQGRVICVSNTSYWEQIDNSTGTFEENAKVWVGEYNDNYYMLIEGIDSPILVRKYNTNY